jgi:hypothetical protein
MTREQALADLHATLPREVEFTVEYGETTKALREHAQAGGGAGPLVRPEPPDYRVTEEWCVVVQHVGPAVEYLDAACHASLAEAVDIALARYWHHALHEGKPPRLIAPSTAQRREARQQQRRRGKDAS